MNLIEMFMQQAQQAQQPRQQQQSEVPASLLAMLGQNQAQGPDVGGMLNSIMSAQAPSLPQVNMPQMGQMGSGLGGEVIRSLLGDFMDERKAKKVAEAKAAEQAVANQEIDAIRASGKEGPELYYDMMKARSGLVQKLGAEGIQSIFAPKKPENIKMFEGGAAGNPSMRQQYMLGPDNKPIPLGPSWKPSSGITVNTGEGPQMQPATRQQKEAWGIDYRVPATMNNKTGEVVAHPKVVTEDQGKAGMNVTGVQGGLNTLKEALRTKTMDPNANRQDYAGDVLQQTGIPVIKDIGNAMKSVDQQKFDQGKAQLTTSIVHLLSGQGFTGAELDEKVKSYVPIWGEDPATTKAKFAAVEALESSAKNRAGPAIQENANKPVERSLSKSGRPIFKNAEGRWEYE